MIDKLRLHNFKRFETFDVVLDESLNIFVGDNECGKSTILEAIDLTLGGSRSRIEALGLDSLFHSSAVSNFLSGERTMDTLPVLWIELFLRDSEDPDLNGNQNSEGRMCDGFGLPPFSVQLAS